MCILYYEQFWGTMICLDERTLGKLGFCGFLVPGWEGGGKKKFSKCCGQYNTVAPSSKTWSNCVLPTVSMHVNIIIFYFSKCQDICNNYTPIPVLVFICELGLMLGHVEHSSSTIQRQTFN